MHLIGIGHRAVERGEIADAMYRCDVAVHGTEGLEHDQPAAALSPQRGFTSVEVGTTLNTEEQAAKLWLVVGLARRVWGRLTASGGTIGWVRPKNKEQYE